MVPSNKSIPDKSHLFPNYLVNRQFSKEKDWLKTSSDEGSDRSSVSPLPPRPASEISTVPEHPTTLQVPKWPVSRQWSDEKPWWQQEDENTASQENVCDEPSARGIACDNTCTSGKMTPEKADDEDGK